MSPPGVWPEMYLACTSAERKWRRLSAAAQVADAGCRARYIGGTSPVYLRTTASVGALPCLPGR